MNCKICNAVSTEIFEKRILNKYTSQYYQCNACDFIQTDEPIWLQEAYNNAITSLDIGLLNRNLRMLQAIPKIIDSCFPEANIMLDYAGGYGVFTRLMRDEGFNFYRQDVYCVNTFAKYFDITDIQNTQFDLVTAFEVFEHFSKPLEEIETILKYSDNVIFSTELIPTDKQGLSDWWYIAEETGQHIAFYSTKTLDLIAKKFGKNYYTKKTNLHLFTNKNLSEDQVNFAFKDIHYKSKFFGLKKTPLNFKIQRKSLLEHDFNFIKTLLNK